MGSGSGAATLAVVVLVSAGIGVGCDDTPDAAGVEALVDEWVAMWNSYDLDRVSDLFVTDDHLTYFSSEREGAIRGFPAVLSHHEGFGFVPGGTAQGNRLWVEDLTIDLFDETAVLTGIWFFQRAQDPNPDATASEEGADSMQGGSAPQPQRGPVTFVCVEVDGRWRFVHMSFGEYLLEPVEG